MYKWIVGIDIGGTSIKLGLFSLAGELQTKWVIPTRLEEQGKYIIDDIVTSLDGNFRKQSIVPKHVLGLGIGIPGFIDSNTGYVHEAINLGWKDFAFKNELEKRISLPIFLENDANIAALGENWKGAGLNVKNLVTVTLGTGVGGGIISNGLIVNGANGVGGELGHIYVADNGIRCNCGKEGCLETIASATGITRQAMKAIEGNTMTLLRDVFRNTGEISAKDVFDLAQRNDDVALQIVNDTARHLGFTLANLSVIVNPEKILIGGGVSKAGDFLIEKVVAAFNERALNRIKNNITITLAKLGNDAGIYGGAILAKQKMEGISF